MDDVHDGVNYMRTACVIAVAKARESFEPFLHQVYDTTYIVRSLKRCGGSLHLPLEPFLHQPRSPTL